ncbi:metallophosphoesterase family protein [Haloarchaeobius salinus]|uniref:metallophosphoesterase family protein n=1 Tax=Haloarchaeobius salinus TaxID=1198298 RepID=UPI00210EF9E1|nr:metallophosphoesterase family protein [Haloarchaeobius salinus]
MQVAIISDSHIPDREESIPAALRERIATADHVLHAGDFTSTDTLATVRELASELTAVHGNVDGDDIDLPSVASVELGGVTFVVTHGTVRSLEDWYDTIAETAREHADEPRVGVGGHTHRLEDLVHDGVRLLNPGSVTGADPATAATMLTAEVEAGEVEVTVHER